MYSVWLTEDQQRIWRSYLAMASRLQTAMHRQLQQDCELSLSDYDVLVALSERGSLRINELGEALAWEQSRLSHQLRRMRGRGLVARQDSGDDRRGATVELTDGGRAALELAAPGHVELVRSAMFDGMPAAQLRAFGEVVEAVAERLATSPSRRT
ncbi:MarR family winged helix-turn-helix transcriptional regulator [Mycobacterium sp. 2YAF39]|uniref:MarR family winged helix-turn-helix transcriptional regulator n=1 Tax=Mycobacterium sp. 2YAF39 TaxID=3233033 RepID=UPI003F967279